MPVFDATTLPTSAVFLVYQQLTGKLQFWREKHVLCNAPTRTQMGHYQPNIGHTLDNFLLNICTTSLNIEMWINVAKNIVFVGS